MDSTNFKFFQEQDRTNQLELLKSEIFNNYRH